MSAYEVSSFTRHFTSVRSNSHNFWNNIDSNGIALVFNEMITTFCSPRAFIELVRGKRCVHIGNFFNTDMNEMQFSSSVCLCHDRCLTCLLLVDCCMRMCHWWYGCSSALCNIMLCLLVKLDFTYSPLGTLFCSIHYFIRYLCFPKEIYILSLIAASCIPDLQII